MSEHCLDAVVVGAGFSGIAATMELKKHGYREVVVVEREDDIGGTWYVNRYPGVAVDVFAPTYQYWFEPNPRWERLYPKGAELHAYAKHVSDKYGVTPHVRFNTSVESAVWDEDEKHWRTTLSDGGTLVSRLLVNSSGFLSQRHYPDITGLDTFTGEILHTTWWDRNTDLAGRRVGVIGTGATSVQLLPELAKEVADLTIYQRTPIWVTPKFDPVMPERVKRLYARVPLLYRLVGFLFNAIYQMVLVTGILNHRRLGVMVKFVEFQSKAMLRLQVRDKGLRQKLTPDYSFGCKRPSLSNAYFPMFTKPHVHLQTAGIERIEADGIVARDGTKTYIDTLILATGFNVWDHNFPSFEVVGKNGVNLGKWWRENRFASYEGLTVPHFPNYIGMTSPFGFSGISFFDGIHTQMLHANRLLSEMRRRNATTFEIDEAATLRWTERARELMSDSVLFDGKCSTANSYYFNDEGDACWFRPATTRRALRDQGRIPLTDYRID